MRDFYRFAKLSNYSQILLLLRIIWMSIKALLHVLEMIIQILLFDG